MVLDLWDDDEYFVCGIRVMCGKASSGPSQKNCRDCHSSADGNDVKICVPNLDSFFCVHMDSLSCTVCCEGFNEEQRCPRLLSCGHTFCTGCLERLLPQSAAGSVVICPSCRQEIPVLAGVKGLPKNFALLDVLFTFPQTQESSDAPPPRHCSACESEHAATFWCVDCKENFCQEASTWHTRTKLTAKHRVVSLEELKAHPELLLRGAASSSIICAEHDEAFRFYDEQCGQVICRDCVALNHNGHKCCSLAVAAAKCREDIGAVLSQAVTRAKQVEEAERVADQVKHNLNQNYEREADNIRATFELIRDTATARESVLLNELKQSHDIKSGTITNQHEQLHTSRMCLESAANRTEAAVVSKDDVRLLVSRGDLTTTLSSLDSLSLLPATGDRLVFSADCTNLLAQINRTGVVSVKSISAAHTVAIADDWTVRSGERTSFTITAHDSTGARHEVGGDTFVVQLQSQQDEKEEQKQEPNAVVIHSQAHHQAGMEVQVADHGDGTYEVSFVLPREAVGDQKLCVSVQGSPIRGSPFLLKAAGLPFDPVSCDGLEVTSAGVIKATPGHHYVIGKERFREGRWKFRVDQVQWVMFGVVEANKAHSSAGQGASSNWPGNYAIATNRTFSNGVTSIASMPFQAGDLVTMELKAGTLSVCNLRSGQVLRVGVPAGEYRLHLDLYGTQVTWQG